jgi:hypothetical protein
MAVVKVVRRVANPRRRARRRLNPIRRRKTIRRRNPALVLTLGAVNPKRKRRKNPMARISRRRRNPRRKMLSLFSVPVRRRRNSRRRRRNPALAVYRRRYSRRRRNPMFGSVKGAAVLGGLTGVAATRLVSKIIPPGILGFAGQFAPLLSDGISAMLVSWAAEKMGGNGETARDFKSGVPFGALMLVGSTAISTFVPGLRQYGFGIGALVPGQFPIPQNPIRPLALPAPAPDAKTRVNTSGLSRAFGTAF